MYFQTQAKVKIISLHKRKILKMYNDFKPVSQLSGLVSVKHVFCIFKYLNNSYLKIFLTCCQIAVEVSKFD